VSSTFELWNPSVSPWQVFSLSQLWIVNTAGPKGTQTVESGWQVFPTKYNTSNAVLFIFSTPDGYKTGCYNHDCPNFVQVNNSIPLGAGFSFYSSISNGTKYMATMHLTWWLYQGNWWLQYGSTWVGYYPGTMYDVGTGTTLHSSANQIQFGGEAVGGYQFFSYNPLFFLPTFPQMGSGYLSNSFFAAQQSSIYYLTNTAGSSAWSKLTAASDTTASCYTSTVSSTTLIFGGGGGYQYC